MPKAPSETPFDMNVDDAPMSGEEDHTSDASDIQPYPPGGHPPGPPPDGPTRVRIQGPLINPDEPFHLAHGPMFPPDPAPEGLGDTRMPEPLAHTPPTRGIVCGVGVLSRLRKPSRAP